MQGDSIFSSYFGGGFDSWGIDKEGVEERSEAS